MLLLGPSLSELLPKNKGQTEQEMKNKTMYSGHRFLDPAISEAEALELLNCASPSISPFFCSFLKVFYFFLIDQYAWMLNHSVVSDSLGPQGL